MTPAWAFIGTAVRIAQDLGMHRSADDRRCPAQDRGLPSSPIFSASKFKE